MPARVWLIGGTRDSVKIAEILSQDVIPVVITVTTNTAKSLYKLTEKVVVAKLTPAQMIKFCQNNLIKAVVDASHPFASQVTLQAIAVAKQLNIPYLRYERPCYQPIKQPSKNIQLANFDELFSGDYLHHQRVLLTIGCQALAKFKDWHQQATLFARILPRPSSLAMAISAGFTEPQIIALRPPVSFATEMALWQQWGITLVVTKASGISGGEDTKHQAAARLDIPLIVIKRPQILYPQHTSSIKNIVAFCRDSFTS